MPLFASPGRPRELGLAIPLVLIVALCADVASRFLSYDLVTFRAWESMQRMSPTGLGGGFDPDARYVSDRAYGDLASMGNQPDMRQYRREVFTTDRFGFRNPSRPPGTAYSTVMVGTSFTAGSSLTDEQTLSAQLENQLGEPVYNAVGLDPADQAQVDGLLVRVGMRSGTFIQEYVESADAPALAMAKKQLHNSSRPSERLHELFGAHYRDVRLAAAWVRGWFKESPLKLELFRIFKALEDDVVLPNPFRGKVVRKLLANGDPILFDAERLSQRPPTTPASEAAEFWRDLSSRLRERGVSLLVVLVPTQYTVYGPLVADGSWISTGQDYLADIERELRARDVPVLNLTRVLQSAARHGLLKHRYIYWRDDTHWNADGASIAATEIATRLRTARQN